MNENENPGNTAEQIPGGDISGYTAGMIVKTKKQHPCGSFEWKILRMGADIWLECCRCGRRVVMERDTFYKRVKGAREQLKKNISKEQEAVNGLQN